MSNDFDTKENATVRYDTVEVENWLYSYLTNNCEYVRRLLKWNSST